MENKKERGKEGGPELALGTNRELESEGRLNIHCPSKLCQKRLIEHLHIN